MIITKEMFDEFVESAEDTQILWTDTLALIGVTVGDVPDVDVIEAQAAEIARLREVIKTQANAVRTLHNNEETEINRLRKQRHEWHHAVTSLDSEREANAILTAEIERLREALQGVTPSAYFGESEQHKAWWAKARAALAQETQP